MNANSQLPQPEIRISKTAYTVWILPVIALCLAMWLIYKNFTSTGILVYITFPDANGMIVSKTAVKFRGIEVGRVRALTPLEDGSGVLAQVEMDQNTEPYLTDKLKFWLVTPHVGIGGVSGLETLLSGPYIQVDGGEEALSGNSTRFFDAFVGEPPVDIPSGLLVYHLVTPDAAGINKGALVYHRNIPVGKVHDIKLSDNHQSVAIVIALEPQYKGLVKRSSRFWNISGLKASFDLSGIDIESSGLAAMAIGGVAFSSSYDAMPAAEGSAFRLYANANAARDLLEVKLYFAAEAQVKVGTSIYYNQQKVGELAALSWLEDFKGLSARGKISSDVADLLRTKTQFWLDTPTISMKNFSMNKLIEGSVIRIVPGSGAAHDEFTVLDSLPYEPGLAEGLHLQLTSTDAYGLHKGSGVYYKSQLVGNVQWIDFDLAEQLFILDVLIYPKYKEMLTAGSQFYNISGLALDANWEGVHLSIPSVDQLITGGIGLYTRRDTQSELTNQTVFPLYASLTAAIAASHPVTEDVVLTSTSLYSPAINTPLYYQNYKIGKVNSVSLQPDGLMTEIGLSIEERYRQLITEQSRFWIRQPISLKANFRQIELTTTPLMSMLQGGIAVSVIDPENPANSVVSGTRFSLLDKPGDSQQAVHWVNLLIQQPTNLMTGAEVKYRGFTVGEVTQLTLLDDLSGINAKVKLFPPHAQHFMREDSQYWLVQPQLNLNGIRNVVNAVMGDSLSVSKGTGSMLQQFTVVQRNLSELDGLKLQLHADQLGSIDPGDPVLYKQLRIGEVTSVGLTEHGTKVQVAVVIYTEFSQLITKQSQFWNASGVTIKGGIFSGVEINTETVETVMAGGISVAIPVEGSPVENGEVFILHPQAQPNWVDGIIE